MPSHPFQGDRARAVLLLSREWAVWYGPGPGGEAVLGRAQVLGQGAHDLATAAAEAIARSGGRSRPCVLALSGGLVAQKLLSLPDLRASELKRVLPRKAAVLAGVEPRQVLYAALPMGVAAAGNGKRPGANQERRWLLVAQDRKLAVELRIALRQRHVNVRRVVVSRLARLCRAQEVRGDAEEACVVIDAGPQAVVTSLVSGGTLHQQGRLEGNLEEQPALGLSLVQEVRGLDAHWRRTNRGGRVGQVVLIGIPAEQGEGLAAAAQTALPEAVVMHLPLTGEEHPGAVERESMAACLSRGPFNLDLTVHVPARHSYVLTLAACLLTVTVGAGTLLHGRLSRRFHDIDERARVLAFQARDLDEIASANRGAEQALEDMRTELELLVEAGGLGIPLEDCLRDGLAAFGTDASLLSLAIAPDAKGGEVSLAGVTDADPVGAMLALDRVAARLERSAHYEDVEIAPPTAVSPDRSGSALGERVAFAATAWREGLE